MSNKLFAAALLLLAAPACVTTYSAAPPLEFDELQYQAPDSTPWPLKEASLPGIAKTYGLPRDPNVAYVELNPEAPDTIVFLHGLGSNLKFWRYQLDDFAKRGYRVLALDMLGYGKSDKPAKFSYTTEAMAEVVKEWMHIAGVERPILVGHSMGGQIALSYAISNPDTLRALVLTAPAGFEHFSKKEIAWFKSVMTVAGIRGASEESIWESIRRNNFNNWKPEFEWLIEDRVRLARSRDFEAYAYANVKSVHGLANDGFVRDNLGAIQTPVLIIHGDSDRLIPNPFLHGGPTRKIMEFGHEQIKGSQLITLAGCGHMVQMDCIEQYNREVVTFLGALGSEGSGRAISAQR